MQKTKNTYKKSGVNINLADQFINYIARISKKNVKKKNNHLNKDNIGAFGSTFDISKIKIKDPLIVSSTDGVGTKIDLANQFNKFDTIGIDLVAMCVNDLIVQGAKPLFFLDYLAVGKIKISKLSYLTTPNRTILKKTIIMTILFPVSNSTAKCLVPIMIFLK